MNKLLKLLKHPSVIFRQFLLNHNKCVSHNKGKIKLFPFSVVDIDRSANIILNNHLLLGRPKYKKSRLETSLWMDKKAIAEFGSDNGGCMVFHGCDIQVFEGAKFKVGFCTINRGAQIICQDEITIGDECMISRGVVIRDNDGGHEILTEGYKKTSPVHIGNHVWVGQNAIIMKGVTIGDGAIIGAGSFVATNVKPGALVMPDPSRVFAKNVEWKK